MANDDSNLSQDAIDALINQVAGNPPSNPSLPVTSRTAAKADAPVKATLSQDDIDAMIGQVQQTAQGGLSAPGAVVAPVTTSVPVTATKIKPPTSRMQATTGRVTSAPPSGNSLGQDDIDRLLAELGGGGAPSQPPAIGSGSRPQPSVPTTSVAEAARSNQPGTTSSQSASKANLPSTSAATLALSPDDLDALMTRQVGVTSDHGEAPMIDQGDIDALVKQLANATNAPDTRRISDALAKHEGEIDKLLATNSDPKATLDAVEVNQLIGKTRATSATHMPGMSVPVMAPVELKGTRWLLTAAVLLLATCAGTLALVMGAINGLAHELKSHHQAQLAPSDSFGDDLKAAQAKLADPDEVEIAKSELFLQRLKQRHPSHEAELVLVLARHFRSRGAFRQAAEEYAILANGSSGPNSDPRMHLDYAEMLAAQHDDAGAVRQVYLVLANEALYLDANDPRGMARPADEMVRNRQSVQDAYLALGRLLNDRRQPTQVAHNGHPATSPKAAAGTTSGPAASGPATGSHAAPPATPHPAAPAATGGHDAHGGHP